MIARAFFLFGFFALSTSGMAQNRLNENELMMK